MKYKRSTMIGALLLSLALSLTPTQARPTAGDAVTLDISSRQQAALEEARKMVILFCISRRLALIELRTGVDLEVQVGEQSAAFRADGVKRLQVPAVDQDYSINGRGFLVCRARDGGGNVAMVNFIYSYLGEGTIKLSGRDVGATVPLMVSPVNQRVVVMDIPGGRGEVEVTLGLRR